MRFGALDYLLKPTAPSELIRVLRKAEKVLGESKRAEIEKMLRTEFVQGEDIHEKGEKSPRHRLVEDAITYMMHHFGQELTTKDMADILHLNPNYFCDLFKKETGTTFLDFLTKIRITMAKQMLQEKINVKAYEIAALVGYSDSRYFGRLFKRETGMTPSEYRQNCIK